MDDLAIRVEHLLRFCRSGLEQVETQWVERVVSDLVVEREKLLVELGRPPRGFSVYAKPSPEVPHG